MVRQPLYFADYARGRRAAKRDGGCKLTLDEALGVPDRNVDLIALDDVLNDLARLDELRAGSWSCAFSGGYLSRRRRNSWADIRHIDDLGRQFLQELEEFFVNYHKLSGEDYRVIAVKGPKAARKCLEKGRRAAHGK